jgi:nucleoside-diphosphate-sugar epimerase
MRVFVTGASGWIGSAVVDELLASGHQVLGLARSAASASSLVAKGAAVQRGDLDDLDSLRTGAASADAVVHLANKHDFANPAASNLAERTAVDTLGTALRGSNRPLLIASGFGAINGNAVTEEDRSPAHGLEAPRGGSENLALDYADQGVASVSVRFAPTVHGEGDHGFIAALVGIARATGRAAYIGDGANRWAAVHRSDAARVVRLGLEKATPGLVLHAVGEPGIPTRSIAEWIGRGLEMPVVSVDRADAPAQFGWLAGFFGTDTLVSSDRTREYLGWTPSGPTLEEDLAGRAYFTS